VQAVAKSNHNLYVIEPQPDGTSIVRFRNGISTVLDTADIPVFLAYRWNVYRYGKGWYVTTGMDNKTAYLHRFLLGNPEGMQVDHRNRNTLDNRRSNLRVCTPLQQSANTRPKRDGKRFKGISRNHLQWRAYICRDRKFYTIGNFATPEEAARAYDRVAWEWFGEFAYLNFPDETHK
jgi:hypothetical protein